jgi:phage protein D
MDNEHIIVELDGEENETLYGDLIRLEVELDDDLMGMFRMQIGLRLAQDGSWTYIDDDTFMLWMPVTISVGFNGDADELLSGFITHLKPHFDADPAHCTLDVWGIDRSVIMDRVETLKDWPGKKDSDIASEILDQQGFSANVEDTQVIHEEEVSTILQRETDWQFLKRLARRNGYEVYVQGDDAYFRPPNLDDPPQPTLAAHFGADTNLKSIALEADALLPAHVNMFQIDRLNKEILDASAESSLQTALGSTGAENLPSGDIDPAQIAVRENVTMGSPEMLALTQAIYHQSEWFVSAEGEIDANAYGHVLLPHRTVLIKGIGETYSGTYYVTRVVHTFTSDGYSQRFRARRTGLGLTGDEDFGSEGGGLLGGLL